jgi:hypothetical protein
MKDETDNQTIEHMIDWCFPMMGLVYPGDLETELADEINAQLAHHNLWTDPHVFQALYGEQIAEFCIAYRRDKLKLGDGSREACDKMHKLWRDESHDDLFAK